LSLPYLYDNTEHLWNVLNSEIGNEFLDSIISTGMYGLTWFESGSRNFYTTEPVTQLNDLKGKKIRVQPSKLMIGLVEALGAKPESIDFGEVYGALQTKVVDGAENNYPSYESTSHYNVSKYIIEDAHSRIPEMIIGSKIAMDKLSNEDFELIKQAAKDSTEFQRQKWEEREQSSKEKSCGRRCNGN